MTPEFRYFKRYRMELSLRVLPEIPPLPDGYFWLPFDDVLLERHACAKYHSFVGETDAEVFPSLSTLDGCRNLMRAIRDRHGFIPGATWLIARGLDYCGTVQGLREFNGLGAIQNVGVTPEHRRRGLGEALVIQALHGFRTAGLKAAQLEVTAINEPAVKLYRRLGFRSCRTVYKAVEVPCGA